MKVTSFLAKFGGATSVDEIGNPELVLLTLHAAAVGDSETAALLAREAQRRGSPTNSWRTARSMKGDANVDLRRFLSTFVTADAIPPGGRGEQQPENEADAPPGLALPS